MQTGADRQTAACFTSAPSWAETGQLWPRSRTPTLPEGKSSFLSRQDTQQLGAQTNQIHLSLYLLS